MGFGDKFYKDTFGPAALSTWKAMKKYWVVFFGIPLFLAYNRWNEYKRLEEET